MPSVLYQVAPCIDSNYEKYACTLINQIYKFQDNWSFQVHLFVIKGYDTRNIRQFCSENYTKLHVYEVDLEKHSKQFLTVGHVTQTAYLKVLIPEYLPKDIKKCTYLDVDVLILKDIADLFEFDSEYPVSAVRNSGESWTHHVAFKEIEDKFNSGVLQFNLEKWRSLDITNKMLETHNKYGALPYLDNDLLVLCLFDYEIAWGDLEPSFNVLDSKANRRSRSAAIVHFAGQRKPWNSPFGGRFSRMYRRELRKVYPDFQISPKHWKQFFYICSFELYL